MDPKKSEICFLCGKENPETREHVPPKMIFPDELRQGTNLIVLKTHSTCNSRIKKDEEYFWFVILMRAFKSSPIARKLWEKFKDGISKPESEGFARHISNSLSLRNIISPGGIFTGQGYVASLNIDRANLALRKICGGLYFKLFRKIFDEGWPLLHMWFEDVPGKSIFKELSKTNQMRVVCKGVFEYTWVGNEVDQRDGVFFLVFYGSVFLAVQTGKNNEYLGRITDLGFQKGIGYT
jgi:hypothetical protein